MCLVPPFGRRYQPAAEPSPSIPPHEPSAPVLPLRGGPSDRSESLRILGPFPPVHRRTSPHQITRRPAIRKGCAGARPPTCGVVLTLHSHFQVYSLLPRG
jgi:hypothetical protein